MLQAVVSSFALMLQHSTIDRVVLAMDVCTHSRPASDMVLLMSWSSTSSGTAMVGVNSILTIE